ncbi:MAG: FAD:protein FMN transferase [Ilumatobacteraceae bacterium]
MISTPTAARLDFTALGTGAVVLCTDGRHLDDAANAAFRQIDLIDRACSRFRPDSDLEAVNGAGGRAVRVSQVLAEALEVALDAARVTDGDVDPTIGSALRLLGYDRDFGDIGPGPAIARFGVVAGWRSVVLDRTRNTVRVPAGIRLDLGATAKALAADRAASAAAVAAGCGVLVGLGGDIAVAGESPEDGWPVKVAEWHGADAEVSGELISVFDGGIATSSTTVRRWQRGDDEMHHVVNPTTGHPADEYWRTVSVVAASCVQANVATTATIVRGERGLEWLRSLGVPARLVRVDGHVVHTAAWPKDDSV